MIERKFCLRDAVCSPIIYFSAVRGAQNYHPSISPGVIRLPSYLNLGAVEFLRRLVKASKHRCRPLASSLIGLGMALLLAMGSSPEGSARSKHKSNTTAHGTSTKSSAHGRHHSSAASASSTSSSVSSSHSRHGRSTRTAHGSHGRSIARHGRHHVVAHREPKSRHAYPVNIFIKSPPPFDSSPLDDESAREVAGAFSHGTADSYPARTLVRAGLVKYHPLHGGIYWRREPVKYIVMHSTETGIPISAVHVIEGWSSMGMRHPGAQYVVDRDGTIYQAVDPDLATVHVNIFKTLPGINNDNSIGIEMNHTGSQNYPIAQQDAVIKLVGYLKHRYNIDEGNIITHRYAQQGDHTDPVNFDWDGFLASVNTFHNQAIAYRTGHLKEEARHWQREPETKINTYLKPHREIGLPTQSEAKTSSGQDDATTASPPDASAPAPGAGKNAPEQGSATMPAQSAVPEPSEADSGERPIGTTSGGAEGGAKSSPVQMKVYPLPGQAPLPGGPRTTVPQAAAPQPAEPQAAAP